MLKPLYAYYIRICTHMYVGRIIHTKVFMFYTQTPKFTIPSRDQQSFPVKRWKINILGFAGHTVSVTTIQLCSCSSKAATDEM